MTRQRALRLAALAAALTGSATRAGEIAPDFDRLGNSVVVSNRFDGENYQVHIAQLSRNGGLLRSYPHSDGYQEVAKALQVDAEGNAVIGGVRYFQGRGFLWLMKYHPSSNYAWEWTDDRPDCTTETVATNGDGDAWIAGLCGAGANRVLRVARLNPKGARLWSQVYDLASARSISDLEVDFGNRASVTALIGQGQGMGIRTLVYGPFGERVAEY